MPNQANLLILLGPVGAALTTLIMSSLGWSFEASVTAGVAVCTVVYWVFEPIPIPATSLLPMAALSLLGVLTPGQIAAAYGSQLILLLLGGFILSTALERCGAHRRLALVMLNVVGGEDPRRLVLGFMLAAAVLSMWISNTATTLMLVPVALATVQQMKDDRLAIPLLLGVAYAASLGGVGTPIGTPPNLIFMQVYENRTGESISFTTWMSWGVPIVLLSLGPMWLWLTRKLPQTESVQIPAAGAFSVDERRVLTIFGLTALAWITRREPFGGWSECFGAFGDGCVLTGSQDFSVAFVGVIALFLTPSASGGRLLDWESANRIPWGMLLLFAGGITLATAFAETGLSAALGEVLATLKDWPTLLLIAVICLAVTFLTEVTSNTATTTLLMPILAAAGLASGLPPELLMVPAAVSASCAYMLPVATAPNTIVFGTGHLSTRVMAREGFALNLVCAAVTTTVCWIAFDLLR